MAGKVVDLRGWYMFDTAGEYTIEAHYKNYADPDSVGAWMGDLFSAPVVIIVE